LRKGAKVMPHIIIKAIEGASEAQKQEAGIQQPEDV